MKARSQVFPDLGYEASQIIPPMGDPNNKKGERLSPPPSIADRSD
jgi:hypothetical protein